MDRSEPARDLDTEARGLRPPEWPAPEARLERAPLDELEGDHVEPVLVPVEEDVHDVRVVDRRRHLALSPEAREVARLARDLGRQHLEGDGARGSLLDRGVDDPHAPLSEDVEDLEAADAPPGRQCRERHGLCSALL